MTLKEVSKLTVASPQQVTDMFNLHRKIFGSTIKLCTSCPSVVRAAQKRLTDYYINNK